MTPLSNAKSTFEALLRAHARGQCDALDQLLGRVARTYRVESDDVLSVLHGLYRLAGDGLATEREWLARARAWLGHPAARSEYLKLRSSRSDARRAHDEATTIAEQHRLAATQFTELTSNGSRSHEPGAPRTVSDLRARLFHDVALDSGVSDDDGVRALIVWAATGTTEATAEFLGLTFAESEALIGRGIERLVSNVSQPVAAVLQRLMGLEIAELAARHALSLPALRMRLTRGKRDLAELVARSGEA